MCFRLVFDGGSDGALAWRARCRGIRGTLKSAETPAQLQLRTAGVRAGVLAKQNPCPIEFVATQDTFGESGTPSQLMAKYGLDKDAIVKKVLAVKNRI